MTTKELKDVFSKIDWKSLSNEEIIDVLNYLEEQNVYLKRIISHRKYIQTHFPFEKYKANC